MELWMILVISLVAGFWVFGMWHALNMLVEWKHWNNGVCRTSGRPWHLIYMANDCARMYSDGAYESIRITYRMVDKFGCNCKKVTM